MSQTTASTLPDQPADRGETVRPATEADFVRAAAHYGGLVDELQVESVLPPAPWTVDRYDALGIGVWRYTVKSGDAIVAQPYGPNDQAIAHAISALPDLLAAVKDWIRWINGETGDATDADLAMHLLQMQAAVCKAEKRS